jgi:hypothetical protein
MASAGRGDTVPEMEASAVVIGSPHDASAALKYCSSGVYVLTVGAFDGNPTCSLHLYDAVTNELLWTGQTPNNVRHFRFCPAANKLFGGNPGSNTIVAWDTLTNESNIMRLQELCNNYMVSNAGNRLYINGQFGSTMMALERTDTVKMFTLKAPYQESCFTDDDDRVVSRFRNKISIIDAHVGTMLLSFDTMANPLGLCVSGDLCSVCSPKQIGVWEVSTGRKIFHHLPENKIAGICFGNNGETIAAIPQEDSQRTCQLICWTVADKAEVFSANVETLSAIVFSLSTARFCVMDSKNKRVIEYDGTTGHEISRSNPFEDSTELFVASKTGNILL